MQHLLHRLSLVAAMVVVASATACATDDSAGTSLDAPLPTEIPPGTSLHASLDETKVYLEVTNQKLPFTVSEWAKVTAGPDVTEAFRGDALDISSNAGIPPIQAHATGVDTKIVGVKVRSQPTYQFAAAPGANVNTVADLRGKRIGFSPGQAQGVIVLRTLADADIPLDQVELVELESTQFLTALQGKQIDVAPMGGTNLAKYLHQYEAEGAKGIKTEAIDALSILWAPTKTLKDPGKLATVAELVKHWARGEVYAYEHPEEWVQKFYVGNEGLTPEGGKIVLQEQGKPYFPPNWDDAITWEQETIDLVTRSGWFGEPFPAGELFDRRFEKIASEAVSEEYRAETNA
ncbi:ABC transporter substrate-binding protein [Mycobacterium sp. DL440]|uniref:ABC transporter substrate-binding protein n=1 Tax=Mycobacterium sp. DL440 TaxID=2675523 RepID=UPI00141DA838|nr:ABC transporter substrate-binding protein [Mycobacterium sp. DL440]